MKPLIKFFALIILILLLTAGVAVDTSRVSAQHELPILAFYYAWFDQNTWTSGQATDSPHQPYASAERATIERHVTQAQSAGINAFVQSWYGPQEANNQTETNFRTLLDVAGSSGFKAAVDLEVTGPFFADSGAVSQAITTLLATHAQHPAYLRYQGKPVIFFWRQQRFPVESWQAIRNQVDPDRTSYWIAEGVDLAYQTIFDGHHLYSIAWAASPAGQLAKWGDRVRAYEAENQTDRLWVATAMPGYDDTGLPRDNAFTVPRQSGDYYRQTWRGALDSQPDMLIITSFNEYLEGTHIEPSVNFGNRYLEITQELITNLRGNPPVAPSGPVVAPQVEPSGEEAAGTAPSAVEQPAPEDGAGEVAETQAAQPPDGPYIETESITNVRSGPSTDFERVGRLAAGETVSVIGQIEDGSWWLVEFEPAEGGQGWVSAEVVNFVGERSEVPVVAAPSDVVADPTVALPTVEISVGGINVRSGPGLDFELLGRLEAGEIATITGKTEAADWVQIVFEDAEDGLGWITAALIDFTDDEVAVPVVTVSGADDIFPTATATLPVPVVVGQVEATDAVNVRVEPSLDAPRLGGLYSGETADVYAISEDGQWWQIEFGDELAWIAVEFVRFTGDRNSVPIFGAGTATPTPGPTETPLPTPEATATPAPAALEIPDDFAPTATSIYNATAAALVESRGTPDPTLSEASTESPSLLRWNELPWGVLIIVLVAGFIWYQLRRRRLR